MSSSNSSIIPYYNLGFISPYYIEENKKLIFSDDFSDIIKKYGGDKNNFLYLDPPYWKQGEQLYNYGMKPEQYEEMANLLKTCKANWIVSHDDCLEFVKLFTWADIKTIEDVPYTINSLKNNRKKELLICKK